MNLQKKIKILWSPSFSYILGIIATDGNLSTDDRHIVLTSKDKVLLEDIKGYLKIDNKIGSKRNGNSKEKKYFTLQIGDKNFYNFLVSIGLTQNKSKTIGKLLIPNKYFPHFLRGCIDGDGNIDVFMHKESSRKQLRIRLASASNKFLIWISSEIKNQFRINGGWVYSPKSKSWQVLTYGKKDSITILQMIYKNKTLFLERKYRAAKEFLPI